MQQWSQSQAPSSRQETSGSQAAAALDWQQFADEFLLHESQTDLPQFDWTCLLDTSTTTTTTTTIPTAITAEEDLDNFIRNPVGDDESTMQHTLNGNIAASNPFSYAQDGWASHTVASTAPQMSSMTVGDFQQQVFSDPPVLQTGSLQRSPAFSDQSMFPSLDNVPQAASASSRSLATPHSGSSVGDSPERPNRIHKRQRNTEAARRYRQRKVDKVTELEEALQSMTQQRDELRLKLARAEAEADVLRGMVGKK